MHAAPLRVLLVDDDEDDFVIAREMLCDQADVEFQLDWAPTVESGLDAIAGHCPDVCVVDFRLGEHNGLDFMRRVIDQGFDIPMVMMTGHGDLSVDVEAARIGAVGYLVKGAVQPAQFKNALRSAIGFARERAAGARSLQHD